MFVTIIYEYKTHLKNLIRQIDGLSNANMDLSQRINIISFDDVGIMTAGINKIIDNLLKTFTSIKASSNEVRHQGLDAEEKIEDSRKATSELSPIIDSFEKNTDTQTSFIKSAIDQFKEMLTVIDKSIRMIQTQIAKVANTSDYVRDMSKAFNEISKTSEHNIQIFNDLISSIEEGNRNISGSIDSIQGINESGKKINEIASIITNIASQTRLLAMNAAIEAAHAGQYGKGFAVVSDEIKKLSESSSRSAQSILTIIREMNEKIQKGSNSFTSLQGTFDLMMVNMNKTRQSLNEISRSTGSHSEKALRNIDEINELLDITNQLKNETENLARDSKNIEGSISLLNISSETLKSGNAALTGGIKNLVRISDEVSTNFKAISESISGLNNKISQYKTE